MPLLFSEQYPEVSAKDAENSSRSSANACASCAVIENLWVTRQESVDQSTEQTITFDNVSKFYGEILGVNRVTLSITPGITSLVGPNGAGKTTLMNLMNGLLQPTRGHISVLGVSPSNPQELFRKVGYCGQFDSFPRGMTGY